MHRTGRCFVLLFGFFDFGSFCGPVAFASPACRVISLSFSTAGSFCAALAGASRLCTAFFFTTSQSHPNQAKQKRAQRLAPHPFSLPQLLNPEYQVARDKLAIFCRYVTHILAYI